MTTWKTVKGTLCRETKYPGVWLLKDGRYWIRARATDPRTKKLIEVSRRVDADSPAAAAAELRAALEAVRTAAQSKTAPTRFSVFATQLYERKVARMGVHYANKWDRCLRLHLIPYFGDVFFDQIRYADCVRFQSQLERILSPTSVNAYMHTLKVIIEAGVAEFELPINPMSGIKPLDTSGHRTYTRENPNSLEADEKSRFLALVDRNYPQLWALFFLGFGLGKRTCELLPLRHRGPEPDILWSEGRILFRRSTNPGMIRDVTKSKKDLDIDVGPDSVVLKVLRDHVARYAHPTSDLLFPGEEGRPFNHSWIARITLNTCIRMACEGLTPEQARRFVEWATVKVPKRRARDPRAGLFRAAVAQAQQLGWNLGLTKLVTPKAMRRTFYLAADRAEVEGRLARLVSGHASESMADLYRTPGAQAAQQRAVVAKVINLDDARRQIQSEAAAPPDAPPAPQITPPAEPRRNVRK